MSIRVDVISIGALARNLLWNEPRPVRTQHATTTVIRAGKRVILVDPGLPAIALVPRLKERLNLAPSDITDIFLTHIAASNTRGIDAFNDTPVWANPPEIDAVDEERVRETEVGHPTGGDLVSVAIDRVKAADDKLAPGVDLFPLPGFTVGTAGLLVTAPVQTVLITGPAVATLDHFVAGQILPESVDYKTAKESLAEVFEIAEIIVPGFDNVFVSPRQFGG